MIDNSLTIKVYSSGTTELVNSADTQMTSTEIRSWQTVYPGGLYGNAEVFIPRKVDKSSLIKHGYRLVILNGLSVVYEGEIVDIILSVGNKGDQGWTLVCHGKWGRLLGRRTLNKPWADQRIDQTVWVYQTGLTGSEKCNIDRYNRLRFTPKAEAWANGDYAAVRYTAPVGQTVKRLTYNYDLQEAAQQWSIAAYRSTDGAAWTLMNAASGDTYGAGTTTVIVASGTGSIDVTFGTPSRYVEFRFFSSAAQTPKSDGTYYGQFSSVMIYTETGNVNAYEVGGDVIDACTDLNSSKARLSSALTFSLVPFVTSRQETLASILQRAASYGDSAYNSIAFWLDASDKAAIPNGKPVLVGETQPAVTDYDYAIRVDEPNLIPPFELAYESSEVSNWIAVEYTDPLGQQTILTPDDDATLKDLTTGYTSRLDEVINIGQATSTSAKNYARRLLAKKRKPVYYMRSPIMVAGYIRRKDGTLEAVSRVRAGKRIKIENFISGDVIFLITGTRHADNGIVSISTGVPDDLAVFLAQKALVDDRRLL